jgi:DsbC/DsbD-like thiol-disulfide interchange protein
MKRRPARLLAFCLLLPLFCSAQQNRVSVHSPQQISAKRGASIAQTLDVAVIPGFHVNSDKPKDEFLIPLKLTWTTGPFETQSVSYPKPEEIKVGGQMLTVFTGDFQIQTKFQVPANAPPGNAIMVGKLHYQACNNEMCFRPASVEVHLPVTVE